MWRAAAGSIVTFLVLVLSVVARTTPAHAQPSSETAPTSRGPALTLDQALSAFRARSFDLRAVEATARGADGDVIAAGQIENPTAIVSFTHVWNYRADGTAAVLGPCITCRDGGPNFGLNDSAALFHTLTGERATRVRVAKAALEAARRQRDDARRMLDFQLKSQYVQVLAAQESLRFAREIDAFGKQMTAIGRARHPGSIDDGGLARLEADALRLELAVTAAEVSLEGEMAGLAFLLDERSPHATYDLDAEAFRFRVPTRLASPHLESLIGTALERRSDLRASRASLEQAKSAVSLARYQIVPDIQLYALYVEQGIAQNTATPPMLTFGVQTALPIFYQQQGEIRRAEADLAGQGASLDRARARVVQDVRTAVSALAGARRIAEVMATSLIERSKRSRDVAETKFREGTATLLDLLDAERQYATVTQEYVRDLLDYWNAVFALEQAVGEDLRQG